MSRLSKEEIVEMEQMLNSSSSASDIASRFGVSTQAVYKRMENKGSEYRSEKFTSVLKYHQISQSMSPKGCPWRNGFQESYYRGFKEDLGDISCCNSIGELVSRVRETINYYNTERMHTALKASPEQFLAAYYQQTA